MMSSDNSTDGFRKTNRPILGDVTNQLGKRAWVSISGNSMQKVCVGEENIVNEKCKTNSVIKDNEKGKRACVSPRACSEINSLRGNIISGISKIASEVKDSVSLDRIPPLGETDMIIGNVIGVGDASRDSCISSTSIPMDPKLCGGDLYGVEDKGDDDEGRVTSEVAKSDLEGEQLGTQGSQTDGISGKYTSVGCSKLPKPHDSKPFELERCIGLKGDGTSNSSTGVELIKACSCSFCTKAAYIWSDLHYQDMKGRIAALKKSQKEAGVLVYRSCRDKVTEKHDQGNSNKISKLESDLMDQWRSLFLHTEDILGRESSQLEASLLTLKELRESCKMDLESVNGMPSQKQ